ncbi:MAG TPA: GNAT family N-acetyltransferase [Actinomycetota bacterium]|nr:GNAT family N-acetyltransferase [Actinomycetota bacterium]
MPARPPHVIETPRLSLVLFTRAHMAALTGRGEPGSFGFTVPDGWAEEEAWLLGYRLDQVEADPGAEQWLMRAILREGAMIGHAGFHGPPNERGLVEIGYTVFEPHRRQGVAHEVAVALFRWAQQQPGVRGFRASVSPGNAPSLALVEKLGFVRTGVQWDEIDGEELVFERPAPYE